VMAVLKKDMSNLLRRLSSYFVLQIGQSDGVIVRINVGVNNDGKSQQWNSRIYPVETLFLTGISPSSNMNEPFKIHGEAERPKNSNEHS
jgi:hypothetical protein